MKFLFILCMSILIIRSSGERGCENQQSTSGQGPHHIHIRQVDSDETPLLGNCSKPCLNGGICLPLGECLCPNGFGGDQCQEEWNTCIDSPIRPLHAMMFTNGSHGEVICLHGYEIKEGQTKFDLECVDNEWLYEGKPPTHVPECFPTCNPKCLSGGTCINVNKCQCPSNYIGNFCEQKFCAEEKPEIADVLDNVDVNLLCAEGYTFDKRRVRMEIFCQEHEWLIEYGHVHCEPICEPKCINGGKCFAPNRCFCTQSFYGEICERRRCFDGPKNILHSTMLLGSFDSQRTLECEEGFKLATGKTSVAAECIEGLWSYRAPFSEEFTPECQPTCTVPCTNGGFCVAPDVCKCPEGFAGRYCEKRYSLTISGKKCRFPFKYRGQTYLTCTTLDRTYPWCATDTDADDRIIQSEMCYADLKWSKILETNLDIPCGIPKSGFIAQNIYQCIAQDKSNFTMIFCPNGEVISSTNDNTTEERNYCLSEMESKSLENVILKSNGEICNSKRGQESNGFLEYCTGDLPKDYDCGNVLNDINITHNDGICIQKYGHKQGHFDRILTSYMHPQLHEKRIVSIPSITSVGGRRCIFPFIHEKRTNSQCISGANQMPWCPTRVNDTRHVTESDLCLPDNDRYMRQLMNIRYSYKGLRTEENLRSLIDDVKELNEEHYIRYIRALGWQRFLLMLKGHRIFNSPPHLGLTLKYVDNDEYLKKVMNESGFSSEMDLKDKGVEGILDLFGRRCSQKNTNQQIKLDHYRDKLTDRVVTFLKNRKIRLPSTMHDSFVIGMSDFDLRGLKGSDFFMDFPNFGFKEEENENSTTDSTFAPIIETNELDIVLPTSKSGEICSPFLHKGRWYGYGSCVKRNKETSAEVLDNGDGDDFACAVETDGKGEAIVYSECKIPKENRGFWFPHFPNPTTHPNKYVILTLMGERCIFPFKYEGEWHNTCVSGYSRSQFGFCAVSVKRDWYPDIMQPCDPFAELFTNKTVSSSRDVPSKMGQLQSFPIGEQSTADWFSEDGYVKTSNESDISEYYEYTESALYRAKHRSICQFPFIYKGVSYDKCATVDAEGPWCATTVDDTKTPLFGSYCKEHIDPIPSSSKNGGCKKGGKFHRHHEIILTVDGFLCQFPFEYEGTWHHQCIDVNQHRQWCKVNLFNDSRSFSMGECRLLNLRKNEYQKSAMTVTGKLCQFPFYYNGQTYNECVLETGATVSWCPTAVGQDGTIIAKEICNPDLKRNFISKNKNRSMDFPFF